MGRDNKVDRPAKSLHQLFTESHDEGANTVRGALADEAASLVMQLLYVPRIMRRANSATVMEATVMAG